MQTNFITTFLKQFFEENDCAVEEAEPGILRVSLSVPMDKAFMNRPFYWQYMESTGQKGEPMTVSFITDKEKRQENGEWVPFGSPRLQQINQYLEKNARFTRLFQALDVHEKTMLQPWLLTNYCIIYEGKQKKEEMFSIGLNLINGTIVFNMMEHLSTISLDPSISDHCYTVSPLIKFNSAFLRIEKYMDQYIEKQNHEWASASLALLEEEINMINYFYQESEHEEDRNQEINAVTKRFYPKIHHHVISGGLLYLDQAFIQTI